MKTTHLLASFLAASLVACGDKAPTPTTPKPKVEAVKPAAETAAPKPPEAPSAAPASAGQDAKPADAPKK